MPLGPTDPVDPAPSAGAHLRAGLLALHLFAITLLALPSAGSGLNRKAWENPTVRGELAAWTGRLNTLGIGIEQEQLTDIAWTVASGWSGVLRTATVPFQPYYRQLGTYQSWRMFVAPHRHPARLHIEIDRGRGWETLYVARSDEHAWRRRQLDQDRLRSAIFRYGWPHIQRRGVYDGFVNWLARQAALDFPDASRLRTRFFVYQTLSPEQTRAGRSPEGHFDYERVRDLDALR